MTSKLDRELPWWGWSLAGAVVFSLGFFSAYMVLLDASEGCI